MHACIRTFTHTHMHTRMHNKHNNKHTNMHIPHTHIRTYTNKQVYDEEKPLTCRRPGCGGSASSVMDQKDDTTSEFRILVLLIILVILPCCVCYMQCGITSFLAGYRQDCPHCKESIKVCRSGMIDVKIKTSLPLGKGNNGLAAEFKEEIRRDVCNAMELRDSQVSVHLFEGRHGYARAMINLISHRTASTLEHQLEDFKRDRLSDTIKQESLPLIDQHKAVDRKQHRLKLDMSAADLLQEFMHQSNDRSSRLMMSKYTQHIVDVRPVSSKEERSCDQCHKLSSSCVCCCCCCNDPKGCCPAVCQRFCRHCATPKPICDSGDVSIVLDLNLRSIPGDEDMFRGSLRAEIAAALGIHPLQTSISRLQHGSIHLSVHFMSCRDAVRMLACLDDCVLSNQKTLTKCQSDFDAPDVTIASMDKFSAHDTQAATLSCKCLTRAELVSHFVMQCEDSGSRLRQGKLFSTLKSAKRWDHDKKNSPCRHCGHAADSCECACPGCYEKLDACRVDCLLPPDCTDTSVQRRLGPTSVDASVGDIGASVEWTPVESVESCPPSAIDTSAGAIISEIADTDECIQTSRHLNAFGQPVSITNIMQTTVDKQQQPDLASAGVQLLAAQDTLFAGAKSGLGLDKSVPQASSVVKNSRFDSSLHACTRADIVEVNSRRRNGDSNSKVQTGQMPQNISRHDIVKVESSGEDSKATGGLDSNRPRPWVIQTKDHTPIGQVQMPLVQRVPKLQILPSTILVESGTDAWGANEILGSATILNYSMATAQSVSYAQFVLFDSVDTEESSMPFNPAVGRNVRNTPSFDASNDPNPEACFCGLEVTTSPPHKVLAVDDLVDVNYVQQGVRGYANPIVMPGDRILAVGGRSAEYVSVNDLHGTLAHCAHRHTHSNTRK